MTMQDDSSDVSPELGAEQGDMTGVVDYAISEAVLFNETGTAGDGSQSGLVVGHHAPAGSGEMVTFCALHRAGYLQPLCGRLADCRCAEQ